MGGLTSPPHHNLCTGREPFQSPILGGLHLTQDDFRTHRAPMPLNRINRMTGPTADTTATPTYGPYKSYMIDDQLETPRSTRAARTRSRTALLTGQSPLQPDYHKAARSGFAASAAPVPPPKASFRSSPLPRSARLGSTIPLGRPASPRPKPASSNPQLDHSRP